MTICRQDKLIKMMFWQFREESVKSGNQVYLTESLTWEKQVCLQMFTDDVTVTEHTS